MIKRTIDKKKLSTGPVKSSNIYLSRMWPNICCYETNKDNNIIPIYII